jgi:hypothetical protein
MATIDDARARLVAGQAAQLRDNARLPDELLRQGKVEEARVLLANNVYSALKRCATRRR